MKSIKFLFLLITTSTTSLVGIDLRDIELFESHDIIYRDEHGQPQNLLQLMENNSIDVIRLHLFTANDEQAQHDPDNYRYTLNFTLNLARRVKQYGLDFMLVFHYSDTWTSPVMQTKPTGWQNLTFENLTITLYDYTRNSLLAFVKQNTIPQYIQIGNEITYGMLWPDGKLYNSTRAKQLIKLLTYASRAVRLVLNQETTIIIHITSSTDPVYSKLFFDYIFTTIDFDIIALSYYAGWDGTLTELYTCLEQLSFDYGKPILIVEMHYQWKEHEYLKKLMKNITGFEETPEKHVENVEHLAKMFAELPTKKRETGLIWWAAEYMPSKIRTDLGDLELKIVFNTSEVALAVFQALGQLDRLDCCVIEKDLGNESRKHALFWIIVTVSMILGILFVFGRDSRTNLSDFTATRCIALIRAPVDWTNNVYRESIHVALD